MNRTFKIFVTNKIDFKHNGWGTIVQELEEADVVRSIIKKWD